MHTTNLKRFNATFTATGTAEKYENTAMLAIDAANPAITSIIICPDTIFANSRIPRLIGLNKNDKSSIMIKNGTRYPGIPDGQKRLKYPIPWFIMPTIIDAKKTIKAIPMVMQSWLVYEKANGKSPIIFPSMMNKNRAIMYGNISMPLLPAFDFTIPPTRKNIFSTTTCNFVGIIPRSLVATQNTPQINATTRNIKIAELVIDISNPSTLIGKTFFT